MSLGLVGIYGGDIKEDITTVVRSFGWGLNMMLLGLVGFRVG